MDEIGPPVQLTVTVVNRGPSSAREALLVIYVPTNDVDGSYYLYLFDVIDSGSGSVTCDESLLNPDDLSPPTGGNSRKKR